MSSLGWGLWRKNLQDEMLGSNSLLFSFSFSNAACCTGKLRLLHLVMGST